MEGENTSGAFSFFFHLYGHLKGELDIPKGMGKQGHCINTQVTVPHWAVLQESQTLAICQVPNTLHWERREPGEWTTAKLRRWQGKLTAKWSMRLVGENVPGEENWHRKERLKKAHKLHSERQPTSVNIIQYAPDVFVVVLKISYAYVSPGTLIKIQILMQEVWGWAWDSAVLTISQVMLTFVVYIPHFK